MCQSLSTQLLKDFFITLSFGDYEFPVDFENNYETLEIKTLNAEQILEYNSTPIK